MCSILLGPEDVPPLGWSSPPDRNQGDNSGRCSPYLGKVRTDTRVNHQLMVYFGRSLVPRGENTRDKDARQSGFGLKRQILRQHLF